MQNPIDLGTCIQVAIVVKNLEESLKKWTEIFNVPMPQIKEQKPSDDTDITYRGKKAAYGRKLAAIKTDKFLIELIEPGEGDSTFREFLDKHGQGVHHIGFVTGESRDGIINDFENMKFPLRTVGRSPGNSWTVVDTEDALGVNLNIKIK